MTLYTLVNVTNLRGNWYIVLQDSKKIWCYPVGWLACTISITLVSKRSISYNLAEIIVLEPFADTISLTFKSACLLDKKNKKEKKRKRYHLSYFLNSDELIMLFDFFPHLVMGVSQESEKKMRLRVSRFYCFRALDISCFSQAANQCNHKQISLRLPI